MSKIKIIDLDNGQSECDISAEKDLSYLLYHLLNQDLRVVILEIMIEKRAEGVKLTSALQTARQNG